jgi:hypothetical protein
LATKNCKISLKWPFLLSKTITCLICLCCAEVLIQEFFTAPIELRSLIMGYRSNVLQTDSRIIVFDYPKGRGGEDARQFLGDWQCHLMVDDYVGYKVLFTADRKGKDKQPRQLVSNWRPMPDASLSIFPWPTTPRWQKKLWSGLLCYMKSKPTARL